MSRQEVRGDGVRTDPDGDALLRAVLANPEDDAPRLILADWWEERGQPERGEFVRVQCELARCPEPGGWACVCGHVKGEGFRECTACKLRRRERELWTERLSDSYVRGYHWFTAPLGFSTTLEPFADGGSRGPNTPLGIVRRGFVHEVRLTTAAFLGGSCGRCEGTGDLPAIHPFEYDDCPDCKGSGRVAGVAAKLFATQPVERVVLTDRVPARQMNDETAEDEFYWVVFKDNSETYRNRGLVESHWLPPEFRGLIRGRMWREFAVMMAYAYDSADAARDALSAACVAYGRRLAGLGDEARV